MLIILAEIGLKLFILFLQADSLIAVDFYLKTYLIVLSDILALSDIIFSCHNHALFKREPIFRARSIQFLPLLTHILSRARIVGRNCKRRKPSVRSLNSKRCIIIMMLNFRDLLKWQRFKTTEKLERKNYHNYFPSELLHNWTCTYNNLCTHSCRLLWPLMQCINCACTLHVRLLN